MARSASPSALRKMLIVSPAWVYSSSGGIMAARSSFIEPVFGLLVTTDERSLVTVFLSCFFAAISAIIAAFMVTSEATRPLSARA